MKTPVSTEIPINNLPDILLIIINVFLHMEQQNNSFQNKHLEERKMNTERKYM